MADPELSSPPMGATEFHSLFAPLTPDGPLPPGLSPETLKRAYRKADYPPPRLLAYFGLRAGTGNPSVVLRKALDSHERRAQLSGRKERSSPPPVHQVLYRDLESSVHGRNIFSRAIAPALEDRATETGEHASFLNAERFALSAATELASVSEAHKILPLSSAEALAQYALAFALLQPRDAQNILAPLLKHSRAFQEYFGATTSPTPTPDTDLQGAKSSEHKHNAPLPPATPPAQKAIAAAGRPQDEPTPSATGIGPAAATLRGRRARFAAAEQQRIAVGSARPLAAAKLAAAIADEERASASLLEYQSHLLQEVERVVAHVNGRAAPFISSRLVVDDCRTPDACAQWLDNSADQLGDLEASFAELERLLSLVPQPWRPQLPQSFTAITSLAILQEALGHSRQLLLSALAKAGDWTKELEDLRIRFSDLRLAGPAPSLTTAQPSDVRQLIRHARRDDFLRPLLPLLFAWQADLLHWSSGSIDQEDLQSFLDVLQQYAKDGDRERHLEMTVLHRPATLQAMLGAGDPVLSRHIVLAVLRASLERGQDWFFNWIWPCARWTNREDTVDNKLFSLFHLAAQYSYEAHDSRQLVAVLAQGSMTPSQEDEDNDSKQAAEDLAEQLELIRGMTGFYLRIRLMLSERVARPLASLIRQRRYLDVRRLLQRLEGEYRTGSLENDIIGKLEGFHEVRAAHRQRLRRDVELQFDAVRSWITKEAARDASSEDDERLRERLQLASSQLRHEYAHPSRPVPPVGSTEWLEREVAVLLSDLEASRSTHAGFVAFGDFAPVAELFRVTSGDPPSAYVLSREWPGWIESTPRAIRTWLAHCHGKPPELIDLLQDNMAARLLHHHPDPLEVVQLLLGAGEFEAASLLGTMPEFSASADAQEAIASATSRLREQEALRTRLFEADERQQALRRNERSASLSEHFTRLDERVLNALDRIDRGLLAEARAELDLIDEDLGRMTAEVKRLAREAASREGARVALLEWLREAGEAVAEDMPIGDAEALQLLVLEREQARRLHIDRVREFAGPHVPDPLRGALQKWSHSADRPALWPAPEVSREIAEHVALLASITRAWWVAFRELSPSDTSHAQLATIVHSLATHVPRELEGLRTSERAPAPLLTLLIEQPSHPRIADFYTHLRARNLLVRTGAISDDPVPSDQAHSGAIEGILLRAEEGILISVRRDGLPGDLPEALSAIGKDDAAQIFRAVPPAWIWARNGSHQELREALAAAHLWARIRQGPRVADRQTYESLAFVFRNHRVLQDRAGITSERLLTWWHELVAQGENPLGTPLRESIAAVLEKLDKTAPGAPERELLGLFLRIGGATFVSKLVWNQLKGSDQARGGRPALLSLLYDFDEDEALRLLLEESGTASRYLWAFVSLARRARAQDQPGIDRALRSTAATARRFTTARAYHEFTSRILSRLRLSPGQIEAELVTASLESAEQPGAYRVALAITPDLGDPPLALRLSLPPGDFALASDSATDLQLAGEEPMYASREVDFLVRPTTPAAAMLTVLLTGDTVSGSPIEHSVRFPVTLDEAAPVPQIPVDELLELYAGYDGSPVTGPAFVGREEELAAVQHAAISSRPGAVLLYGARRLGKTSLLDVVRHRHCLTHRKGSQVLIVTVGMDSFQATSDADGFHARVLRHISHQILTHLKNAPLREAYSSWGTSAPALRSIVLPDREFAEHSFAAALQDIVSKLRAASGGRVAAIVFAFDEFDKLLESYRRGLRERVEELVSQLRMLALEHPHIGLVIAGSDLMKLIIGSYRSALFGSAPIVELACFDAQKHRAAAERIISPERLARRRVFPSPVISEIVTVTGGHPYLMRILALASVHVSRRQVVSRGTVHEAVHRLLRNEILHGYVADPPNLVRGFLGALAVLPTEEDELLANLLLCQVARHTSLEVPRTHWGAVSQDDSLLALRPPSVWAQLRDTLHDSRLLASAPDRRWGFRYPIMAEAIRLSAETDFERYRTRLESLSSKPPH